MGIQNDLEKLEKKSEMSKMRSNEEGKERKTQQGALTRGRQGRKGGGRASHKRMGMRNLLLGKYQQKEQISLQDVITRLCV